MTAKDTITRTLHQQAGPVCDDCLVPLAGLSRRQIANQVCTELHRQGVIGRGQGQCHLCGKRKTVNWALDTAAAVQGMPVTIVNEAASTSRGDVDLSPWYWEGHVQATLVSWLDLQGFTIRGVADTAARTPGKDIIAVDATGRELWVSVKGFPAASKNTQARHWFAGAIFDLILYRGQDARPLLAIALPDGFTTYRSLAARTAWLRTTMPFTIYWVGQDGSVRAE